MMTPRASPPRRAWRTERLSGRQRHHPLYEDQRTSWTAMRSPLLSCENMAPPVSGN